VLAETVIVNVELGVPLIPLGVTAIS